MNTKKRYAPPRELRRPDPDYETLDPGVREVVRLLRAHGFETTDSGDGVSKPADWYESGEALRTPHVFAVSSVDRLVADAITMQQVLDWHEWKRWRVEATYAPRDGSVILMAWGQ